MVTFSRFLDEIGERGAGPRERKTMCDNIISTFLESGAAANTFPVTRHRETREAEKSDEEYTYYSFTIKGTKGKIGPVTLTNKGKQADPRIYVFTSGDEADSWFAENNVDLDKYLASGEGKGLVG